MVYKPTRGNASTWDSSGTVLAEGQLGVVNYTDGTRQIVVGDGSHTRSSLPRIKDPLAVSKGDLILDVRDYGAVGDGTTNDTTAIGNAAAAASALKVLTIGGNSYRPGATVFFPPGKTFNLSSLSSPIVLSCNVNGAGATLLAPQTYAQAVLRVGHPTSGNLLHTADISLPDVTKTTPATDFTAGSIGVEIRNLYHSRVRFGRVSWFETAHLYNGVGMGTCYNTFHPGWVDLCKVGYALRPDVASGGWINQNTWLAGGIAQAAPNGMAGGASHRTGYRHVVLDGGAGNTVSGNTFVGCSFEGDYSEYFIEFINAADNVFLGSTRFEQGTAGRAVTITTGTDTITTTSTPLGAAVGDPVTFLTNVSFASPITAGTIYYVKTVSGNDFTISTTSGGSTLDLTTAGSGMLAFRAPIIRFDNTSTFNKGNRITEDYNSYPGPIGAIRVGSAAPAPLTPILG